MTEPTTPKIVTRDEWERARAELLGREKAHTHAGDALAAARRRLPMTPMDQVNMRTMYLGGKLEAALTFWNPPAPENWLWSSATINRVAGRRPGAPRPAKKRPAFPYRGRNGSESQGVRPVNHSLSHW